MPNKKLKTTLVQNCPICKGREYSLIAKGTDFEYGTTSQEFKFVKCSKCEIFYLQDKPLTSELKYIYPNTYSTYSFQENKSLTFLIRNKILETRRIKQLAKLFPHNAVILDAGCGDTALLKKLREINVSWKLWGNDINKEVISNLRKEKFNTMAGRFENISKHKQKFDVIIMNFLIEHLSNPVQIMNSAYKILNRNGILIISTPNKESLSQKIFAKRYWQGYHFPRHWVLFDISILKTLANICKFDIKDIKYLHAPYSWIISIHNLLKDKGVSSNLYNIFSLSNPVTMGIGSIIDLISQFLTGNTASIQIILIKK